MDSSIKCKSTFEADLKEFKNLVPVSVPKWAGVGAVRFMPDYLSEQAEAIAKYQEAKLRAKKAKKGAEEVKPEQPVKTPESEEPSQQTPADQAPAESSEEVVAPKSEKEAEEEFVVDEVMEKHVKDINNLNDQLVKKLQAQDGAFSIGEASDEMLAVKFGMINESDALKSLALQVQDAGRDVEEASRVKN